MANKKPSVILNEKHLLDSLLSTIGELYRSFARISMTEEERNLCYRRKENNQEFGYYLTYNVYDLAVTLNKLKKERVIDLGCGVGILMQVLNTLGFRTKGFEIEDCLITRAGYITNNVHKKDITEITTEDIKDYEVLYFWEPIPGEALSRKFVENLEKVMLPGQMIVYKPDAPHTFKYLENSLVLKRYKRIKSRFCIYIKK